MQPEEVAEETLQKQRAGGMADLFGKYSSDSKHEKQGQEGRRFPPIVPFPCVRP
ncbi:hypothetical protein HMPREF9141_1302 [Prevotella multiformis DSM 16608]|uniref:Uncharacterized protein n=1 Tax=Prevotella multiformis DSM 16608 TaxID=888743 RepID=F0F6T5_9BACT|nr:hypothetical protein HMPREF9141_1302 [Prevotella multiformis DSM 16608]